MNESKYRSGLAPIFIMGCQRSGTTLVSQILAHHPRLAIYHESFFYHILFHELKYYGDLLNKANLRQLVQDVSKIVATQSREIDVSGTPFLPTTEEILQQVNSPDFAGVVQAVLEIYTWSQSKQRCGDKTPENYQYLNQIRIHFPDSPVIFLMRDPRDTILSSQRLFNFSLIQGARMWNSSFHSYIQHKEYVNLVRYEKLVTHPQQVIQDLCDYIGESYTDELLSFYQHIPKSFLAKRKNLALVGKPISSSSIGNFEDMKSEDIRLIEAYCNEGISTMGYEFSQSPQLRICLPEQGKEESFRFYLGRLRYYGFNLERWRHGWARWELMLRARLRYYLCRISFLF